MIIRFIVVAAVACLFASFDRVARAAPGPTLEDARAHYVSGDYPACLRKIAVLLPSKPVKSDPADRYDLLMLRGECLLRLKQRQPATDAFESAAAVMKKHTDLPKAASATALAVLVKASPDLTYKPK